jgi:hypothetical protein
MSYRMHITVQADGTWPYEEEGVPLYGTTPATELPRCGTIFGTTLRTPETQQARCYRTGPDLQLQLVAGVGFEPTTFGL